MNAQDTEALKAVLAGPLDGTGAARARLDRAARGIIRRAAIKAMREAACEVHEAIKLSPANSLALRKIGTPKHLDLVDVASWSDCA